MVLRSFSSIATAAVVVLLCSSVSAAPPCSPNDRRQGGKLADKGFELFEAADYPAAIDHFSRADERCHSPRLVVFMARAHARLGKLLRARELLEQVTKEDIGPRAPASFRDAQIEARKDLEQLRPRIPVVQLLVTGAPAGGAHVTLDGADASLDDLSRGRELDPGDHTLVVESSPSERVVRHVNLRESVTEKVEVDFSKFGQKKEAPPPQGLRPMMVGAIVAFGVGALGVGVGVATGIASANKVSDIESRCVGSECLVRDGPNADTATTLGTVSTISFVLGGLGLAGGTTLFFLDRGRARAADETGLKVTVGPRAASLRGRW